MIGHRFVVPSLFLVACTTEGVQERLPGPAPDGGPAADGAAPSEDDAGVSADAHPVVDATPPDAAAPDADPCAVAAVERWTGTASRDNDNGYPDHITATVTWDRVATEGCVDHYVPTGTAHYAHAIPGALCSQSISPETHPIETDHGALTIDRTTSPPTYAGGGETYWPIVFRCEYPDGSYEESSMDGGAIWLDAAGAVAGGTIEGSYQVTSDDENAAARCGPNGIGPCTYAWSFTIAD